MTMKHNIAIMAALSTIIGGCSNVEGSYGYDREFFEKEGIETVELSSEDGKGKVLIVPAYQGRVMTSSTDGDKGKSYGWINRRFIASGEVNPQFNSFGGEERFWIGPEGGRNSWYFAPGAEQIYANWLVPKVIDTEGFDIDIVQKSKAAFSRKASLTNASGVKFDMLLSRTVAIEDAASVVGTKIPEGVKAVCYSSTNVITNTGKEAWTKDSGMPSVWILGCFNPTPTTTVFIPYDKNYEGKAVKDDYFGEMPEGRLVLKDGIAYFKIDGKLRAKIGLPQGSAKDLCGSYDSAGGVLTILKYTVPDGPCDYVNSQWGEQENAFGGDVINSYNDGPTDTGVIMGPFYEIETSSPGAALKSGESLSHKQYTIHLEGSEKELSKISEAVFGISLEEVKKVFE